MTDIRSTLSNLSLPLWGYALITGLVVALMLIAPQPIPFVIFTVYALVILRYAISIELHKAFALPTIQQSTSITIELLLIASAFLYFVVGIRDFSPGLRPPGSEFSYLTNSGAIAHEMLFTEGRIAFWNPYLGHGEPLVEGPFSYLLNPFMSLPVLILGAVQGAKVVIIIHGALAALGGWVLGWVVGLGSAGRVLLALLLLGNGSMVSGLDHFQMGLSQAYIPWVYAAVISVINLERRWPVGLLVTATYLLMTAGTFWYVLPTAIGAFVLTWCLIAKYEPSTGLYVIDRRGLRRLAFAAILLLFVAAVRLIPGLMNQAYVYHPEASLVESWQDFREVFNRYFEHQSNKKRSFIMMEFHYIISPIFFGVVIAARLFMIGDRQLPKLRLRHIIASLVLIVFFTAWAQGPTPLMRWFYTNIPLLEEWRILGRMQAAGSVWLALLAAICFDDLMRAGIRRAPRNFFCALLAVGLFVLGTFSSLSVLRNWSNISIERSIGDISRPIVVSLRDHISDDFIMMRTPSFYDYLPFYEHRIRATFGNPDYRALPRAETIDSRRLFTEWPPFVITDSFNDPLAQAVWRFGYLPIGDNRSFDSRYQILWYDEDMLTYAFTVPMADLTHDHAYLEKHFTMPISQYQHRLDSIHVVVPKSRADDVLVLHEVAHPGWEVVVNGQPGRVESIDGMLGTILPASDGEPVDVTFRYRPIWFQQGMAATLPGIFFLTAYLLRVDRLWSGNNRRQGDQQHDKADKF